jgi:CRISPR-associated protein Cas1
MPEEASIELIPARMLNEFVYCPRLFHIEYVQGDFVDSADTISGRWDHRRVDKPSEELDDDGGFGKIKAVTMSSERFGLIAKMDLVELQEGQVLPVDYKHGKKPGIEGGAWLADKVQLCAQALVLRENGFDCKQGAIYYKGSKERVYIDISDELIDKTLDFASRAREAIHGPPPKPLEDSPKCVGCSLAGICLPDETSLLGESEKDLDDRVRRLYPARDDAAPAYVIEQGAVVTKSGEELVIKKSGEKLGSIRLMELSHLSVMGNVQITTQTVHELCGRGIPICYLSTGGWFYGTAQGMGHKNVQLRIAQFRRAENPERSLELARRFIQGKIKNCRTMLRRNSEPPSAAALEVLADLIQKVGAAMDHGELLGLEGSASRVYFSHFRDMLSIKEMTFDMTTRNRRPPKDPVNAMLSLVYSMLAKDCTVTLLSVGFDPHLGFLHRPRYGKPALALDLMEEFRPIIGDSVVIGAINNREITGNDFVKAGKAVSLSDKGRRTLIAAYERRMDTLIRHPIFGYTISYRRTLEVQARLMSRFVLGEIKDYVPFCTR